MQRNIGLAVVSMWLVLTAGCVVQNGRVMLDLNAINRSLVENDQLQKLRQKAEQGDAIAQFTLGSCYANGRGVLRNYPEAVKWYRLSAEQGYAEAQNRLGVCYSKGLGVIPNYAEAAEWYRKAAEQGNAFAQDNLGACYSSGHGVAQDYAEAVKWYRLSAEQGNAFAQNHLGVCYYKGHGVTQNYAEAVEWYRKAAEQGNLAAKNNLRFCESEGLVSGGGTGTDVGSGPPVQPPQTSNPTTSEPNEATAGTPFSWDEIKALIGSGVKADSLIDQIKSTNSKFTTQDIAAAQQANPPVDPAIIECMKANVR